MNNYRKPVQEFAAQMVEAGRDILGEDIGIEEYQNRCLEKCLEKFVKGESFYSILQGEETIEEILRLAALDTTINSLKKKGLVDSIEDENGNNIDFLTREGKAVRDQLREEN